MQAADNIILAGLDDSFGPVVARNAELRGSNPGRWDVRLRVCAYTVLQTGQRPGLRSAVCGTMHYKEPLKSFDMSRVLSRLLASLYRDIAIVVQKAKQSNIHTADIIHYSFINWHRAYIRLATARDRYNVGLVALLLVQET